MQLFGEVVRKVSTLLRLLGNPMLLNLKRRGVDIGWFLRLNQPWILSHSIRTVVDIGAHTGQFTRAIHELLPAAKIYSFEPLADCFEALQASMGGVANFVPYNLAIGDTEGEIEFYRSSFTPSSSPRMMVDLHKQLFPFSAGLTKVQVSVSRLDTVSRDMSIQDNLLIKVDVQGYEDKVLSGGEHTFAKARIVIIEVAFQILYEEQPSFDQIYQKLKALGFEYRGALAQCISPVDESVIYADCIFIKRTGL